MTVCTFHRSADGEPKRKQHICHVENCGKVYWKTSHLRAHLRSVSQTRRVQCQYLATDWLILLSTEDIQVTGHLCVTGRSVTRSSLGQMSCRDTGELTPVCTTSPSATPVISPSATPVVSPSAASVVSSSAALPSLCYGLIVSIR